MQQEFRALKLARVSNLKLDAVAQQYTTYFKTRDFMSTITRKEFINTEFRELKSFEVYESKISLFITKVFEHEN